MVLLGDAVHTPSSSSGQGASQAAESAIELARCLRDLTRYRRGASHRVPIRPALCFDDAAREPEPAGASHG